MIINYIPENKNLARNGVSKLDIKKSIDADSFTENNPGFNFPSICWEIQRVDDERLNNQGHEN